MKKVARKRNKNGLEKVVPSKICSELKTKSLQESDTQILCSLLWVWHFLRMKFFASRTNLADSFCFFSLLKQTSENNPDCILRHDNFIASTRLFFCLLRFFFEWKLPFSIIRWSSHAIGQNLNGTLFIVYVVEFCFPLPDIWLIAKDRVTAKHLTRPAVTVNWLNCLYG